jgi:hypothetical protein
MLMVERREGRLVRPTIKSVERFILMCPMDRVELLDLERTVAANIGLRAEHGLDVLTLSEQVIVEHIAKSIYFAAKYLGQPLPDRVGFIEGQRGVPNMDIDDGCYTVAEGNRPADDRPGSPGSINFSPHFLKTKIHKTIETDLNWRRGRFYHVDSYSTRKLAELSWHEIYHFYQEENDSVAFIRDLDILENDGRLAWMNTPTEQGARRFEHAFANGYVDALLSNSLI